MIRISHALVIGLFVSLFVGIFSFLAGWTFAIQAGSPSLNAVATRVLATRQDETTPEQLRDQFRVFWDVWNLVDREFYHQEPIDDQQRVYGAIRGMLASLDDEYTVFQEPEAAQKSRESMQGKFEGIGVYMRFADGQIIVERPIKNSPAMKAGLVRDDIIVRVDGADMAPLIKGRDDAEAMDEAATRIRGPKGSSVRLTVFRPSTEETFEVDIIRDEVPLISVHAQMLPDGVAYLQITEFKANTANELDEALRQLLPQNPNALILDLRNNPGGFLNTAQEVLGRFYDGIALYEEYHDGNQDVLRTIRGSDMLVPPDIPMVVLINGNAASASEIVAGALREQRPNTVLLGETSFGKGSVQNVHQLHDGSSARITIAHWLTPNQQELHAIGIEPDFLVPFSEEAYYAVPCTGERRSPDGSDQCPDSHIAWSIHLLTNQTTPLVESVEAASEE